MADVIASLVTVTPRPYEVGVARVPAGSVFRVPLRNGAQRELPPDDLTTWLEVPGLLLARWGVDWTIRYSAHSIGLARLRAERKAWQQAARMLAGGSETAKAVYVLLEETRPHGRPVWLAVSIRTGEPGNG